MPEIAEVETVRVWAQDALVGANIAAVDVLDDRLHALQELAPQLVVQQLTGTCRHGKRLGFQLTDGRVLTFHLRMTGSVVLGEQPYARMLLQLTDPDLTVAFCDPRRFGTVDVLTSEEFSAGLGPDVLDNPGALTDVWERAGRSRRALKTVLLDQTYLAGLGNWMGDELLWSQQLHPSTPVSSLTCTQWQALMAGAHALAQEALARGGVSMRDYRHPDGSIGSMQTQVRWYGRSGQPCLRCGGALQRIVVGGRGTAFCPECQPPVSAPAAA